MADGNRAAVRVDARVLEIDVHELEAAEHLAREGLVDLDDVHVAQFQLGSFQGPWNRIGRPHAHDARLDAGARRGADARERLLAVLLAPLLRTDQQRGAPSFTPEALPAVTTPPSKSGFSLVSASIVESRRGCSSASTFSPGTSFFLEGSATARISPL